MKIHKITQFYIIVELSAIYLMHLPDTHGEIQVEAVDKISIRFVGGNIVISPHIGRDDIAFPVSKYLHLALPGSLLNGTVSPGDAEGMLGFAASCIDSWFLAVCEAQYEMNWKAKSVPCKILSGTIYNTYLVGEVVVQTLPTELRTLFLPRTESLYELEPSEN